MFYSSRYALASPGILSASFIVDSLETLSIEKFAKDLPQSLDVQNNHKGILFVLCLFVFMVHDV